ncbi:aminotransferase class III-fold pyridoxal phosphate-dependent enzyme [Aliikangiella maris]|uniref:Aminotransferase class III-fold pyridoxal phosphate-dependent enzyme n=2 Tax=Aliikangiella maris TaxID=3162458 RepID=A0ABV2BYY6_9GAMM
MYTELAASVIGIYLVYRIFIRLRLSRAKHPSLRGHSKWSRRIAKQIPFFSYDQKYFFACDGAPEDIQQKRKAALEQLKNHANSSSPKTIAFLSQIKSSISDIIFTSAYRIPFPFRDVLHKELLLGSIVDESKGVQLKDIDGNWRYDLSGSYGVNVFGYDFYKDCIQKGAEKVQDLGPVLGPYHPVIQQNVEKIKKIAGLDEVSFHMSGTEAVMQAVRLARYHTGRSHLVRFCGAYHGWWDGVQPGIGNQRQVNDVYTLSEFSEATIKVLETRKDIACVLINPLQAFHPNSDGPSDSTLVASNRATHFDREKYADWLQRIRNICTQRNIVLIFDEIFTGFRLGYRGAQEYFNVQADMVTYGKTLGGGLPIGVLCGKHHLMKRFKDDSPAFVSFARGTFNSHPYVMGTMNEFLNRIESPEIQQHYSQIESIWNERVQRWNDKLAAKNLPIKIESMHTILTVIYLLPSRFNWMLQFYLRANNLELAWIGTGRFIMPFNVSEEDFENICDCFIQAVEQMQADQWWWQPENYSNKVIQRLMLNDILRAKFPILSKIISSPAAPVYKSDKETIKRVS